MGMPLNKVTKIETIELKHTMLNNALIVMPIGFTLVGLFSLKNGGYLFPSPYICFLIAFFCWLIIEKEYARFNIDGNTFKIKKGFLILKGYKTIQLPFSNLISLVGSKKVKTDSVENKVNQLCTFTVTYYNNEAFYENEIYCEIDSQQFDLFEQLLVKNHVHFFINDSE